MSYEPPITRAKLVQGGRVTKAAFHAGRWVPVTSMIVQMIRSERFECKPVDPDPDTGMAVQAFCLVTGYRYDSTLRSAKERATTAEWARIALHQERALSSLEMGSPESAQWASELWHPDQAEFCRRLSFLPEARVRDVVLLVRDLATNSKMVVD